MTQQEEFLFERLPSGVGIATLNRPERRNALSPGITEGLATMARELSRDRETKVVILRGAGKAFCSGGDVGGFYGPRGERPAWRRPHPESNTASILRDMDQPVIGAIHGYAVGAGFGLALSTDLRIAAEGTRFGVYQIRRGIVADGGLAYLLPKIVGNEKAFELMALGEDIDAQEALRLGLVSRVVPEDRLMETAMEVAERIARGPSIAISVAKRAMYHAENHDLVANQEFIGFAQSHLFQTEDAREGAKAFMEKRQPQFKGR